VLFIIIIVLCDVIEFYLCRICLCVYNCVDCIYYYNNVSYYSYFSFSVVNNEQIDKKVHRDLKLIILVMLAFILIVWKRRWFYYAYQVLKKKFENDKYVLCKPFFVFIYSIIDPYWWWRGVGYFICCPFYHYRHYNIYTLQRKRPCTTSSCFTTKGTKRVPNIWSKKWNIVIII